MVKKIDDPAFYFLKGQLYFTKNKVIWQFDERKKFPCSLVAITRLALLPFEFLCFFPNSKIKPDAGQVLFLSGTRELGTPVIQSS